jgi:LytR cell envelope-related transcriptional attenuator
MQNVLRTFVTFVVAGFAVAFAISFGLGLRRPHEETVAADPVPGVFSGRRVEILNGVSTGGLARDATELLRAAGYDVVYFGNAGKLREPHSIVLDRVGKPELARAIANQLQITRVETRRDSTRLVEVTVILGDDWVSGRGRIR